MKHLHHIIPRHAGGGDDPANLIELTIDEHAEAHRILYEQYNCWQDYVAWKGLLGLITAEERMIIMYNARKGTGNHFFGKKHTEETKRIISEKNKGRLKGVAKPAGFSDKCKERMTGQGNPMYGTTPWNKGKIIGPQSAESRRKKGKPLIYNGVEYNSLNEAEKLTGISAYKLGKICEFI